MALRLRLLVAPEDSTSLHLKALARVSRLLRDGNFRDKLLTAPNPAASEDAELFRAMGLPVVGVSGT